MNRKKKIVLIGPVYPYKGGISHYTGLMCRALSKDNDVYMMSYKLQYPKFLFRKEQCDYRNDSFKVENTDFYINTVNPINWIKTAFKIRSLNPDLVIIQWWHPYFSPCYWSICKLLAKIKILFVCHNVYPHERFPMDKFLTKRVLVNGDFFLVHSSLDEKDLYTIKSDARCCKTVLPTFNAFKIQNFNREEGRNQLGISGSAHVLLFFGFVREYKGLKHLINALPKVVSQLPQVKLLIVGDFNGDKETYIRQINEQKVEDFIEIHDGYIPDREVEKYFAASDLVVLPYESATQSAVVQIAYGFEKPVIATNVGGLPEVVLDGKTGYVVEPQNSDELANKIIDFFENNKESDFRLEIANEKEKYSWDRMAQLIFEMCGLSD